MGSRVQRLASCIAVVVVVGLCVVARADTPPWAVGVSDAQKAKAQQLLDAGNQQFLDKSYAAALDNYKAAIAVWDHPAIRFNIVRCLIQLDRPVEAAENLELALKYGAAPLEEAVYAEALAYKKLLAAQIADLDIKCEQDGVHLTLDGQPLATCPAHEQRRVSPGSHQIVGAKDGFVPRTVEIVVLGGKRQDVAIALVPLSQATHVVHRWQTWIPWAVFGGGLAVAGVGGLVELKASSDMAAYDRTVTHDCAITGCAPGTIDHTLEHTATLENRIAIGVMTVGLAAAATGAAMLYMNRGRETFVDVAPQPGGAVVSVTFTP